MTTSTVAARKVSSAAKLAAAPLAFAKGKGAPDRNASFGTVAVAAYTEGRSRADTIAILRDALGKAPTDAQVTACKSEYVIGRVAFRIAADKPVADAIALARDVVLSYAAPAKDGVTSRKLRKGQKDRRTVEQHKAVRAAEEAWSQVKAEACPAASNATTQADRNKAKRAPHGKVSQNAKGAKGAVGTGITHSELVRPDGKPIVADDAARYLESMAATMLAFCNKHAAVTPTDYGMSVKRFHGAIMELAKAREALKGADA